MASGRTVCVCGFPAELPPERVADKLTIHFLRARNGGGEIANIEFAPESPDCAMVTFEEAAVAQRVLKTGKHVLNFGGRSYPLQVGPCTPGLNPNEIFVHVTMKIDYGRVPGGKEILQSLCKQYGDMVFRFHSQEMTCLATGSFTESQAFSSELVRCFQSKQRNSRPDKNSTPDRRRSADKIGGSGSSLQGVPKTQAEKKDQKATSERSPPRNPKEWYTELLEDFSLVMDSDVYCYMQKFCRKELDSILRQHQVGVMDVSSEGIATLYLQAASEEARGARALTSAHLALSRLSQQLEATLRKEKISLRDLGGVEGARGLLEELQKLCPLLLCHQDAEDLCLIGNVAEVAQAREYAQGFIAAREAGQDHRKLDVPQAVSMAQIHGKSPSPFQDVPSAEFLPRKQSLPRWSSGKMGCKLATRFSASDSSTSLPPFSSRGTPLGGPLSGDFLHRADSHSAETRNHTLWGVLAPESGSQVQQSFEIKQGSPATMSGGPLPGLEARRSLCSRDLLLFCAPSSTVRSSDLFGALESMDPKVSDLERPNNFLLPKSQNSRDSVDEPLPVARINVDHFQPSSRKEGHRILQQDVSQEGRGQEADFQVPRECLLSPALLAVQEDGVSQEGPSTSEEFPVGVLARPPDHIHEWFSYSKLAVEGPEDGALVDLCSRLKACHDHVAVSRERHHLGLVYPQAVKQHVLEVFHCFTAQRLAVLTEQLLSHDAQQGQNPGRHTED